MTERGFDLRRIQLAELEILLEVDRICKKHNIKYSMAWGTALGAVRHQGFIPWDDDIDVFMSWDDYKKFKEVSSELPQGLFYQDWHTDKLHFLSWAKIRNSNTTSMEKGMEGYPMNWGICIDIFPMIPWKNTKINAFDFTLYKLFNLFSKKRVYEYNPKAFGLNKSPIHMIPDAICDFMRNVTFNLFTRKRKNAKYIFDFSEGLKLKNIYSSELIDQFCEKSFEGHLLSITSKYDEYLKQCYGDYMVIPKVHEQIDHGDIIVDFEKSFQHNLK